MNNLRLLGIAVLGILIMPHAIHARYRTRCSQTNQTQSASCLFSSCGTCPKTCSSPCSYARPSCTNCLCGGAPFCGPYPRPLPGQYDSYADNTRIRFWNIPPCGPRNDSKERGYLYKGMWWDNTGVRYWAIRNSTDNVITVEGLEGGEIKDIPAGDVVNIARGESYNFRIQAPAHRFELFSSDAHNIEVVINLRGDIDYRIEQPNLKTTTKAPYSYDSNRTLIMPKF